MCGGTIEFNPGDTVGTCDSCGTKQTLPRLDDDKKVNSYDRANHFRRNNDYDKAMGIYEQVLNEDSTDAEAYWSLVLCRYGIEYVENPATHKRVPTVNRAQFTSIFDDDNYKSALKYADFGQKAIYEEEAKTINEIQKGILAISQKEEPFDVFICYKETDNNGRRTQDSVLANDLYHQLTQESFKVFFSRSTLEDKLGTAYEPYIFAALNSAKVMVVIGTKPEYFNAVWVKNEWSRYLALIRNGAKKMLIPAYRDMDPYDLPEEFSHLQAQDMSKLGFMQDLIRGIKKITGEETPKEIAKETIIVKSDNANIAPLLKRAFMFLEDGDWSSANEYCERVLDLDPENAGAYLGKLMSKLRVRKQDQLRDAERPFDGENAYQKVMRFADEPLKSALTGYLEHIRIRNENERLQKLYDKAAKLSENAATSSDYEVAAAAYDECIEFKDSAIKKAGCLEQAEKCRKDEIYEKAVRMMNDGVISQCEAAIQEFQRIPGYRDVDAQISFCQKATEEATKKAIEEADRLERERKAGAEQLKIAERKKLFKIPLIINLFIPIGWLIAAYMPETYASQMYIGDSTLDHICLIIFAVYMFILAPVLFVITLIMWKKRSHKVFVVSSAIAAIVLIAFCIASLLNHCLLEPYTLIMIIPMAIPTISGILYISGYNKIAEEKVRIKQKKILKIATPIACVCVLFVIILATVIIPNGKYKEALKQIDSGDYISAYTTLESLGDYKESQEKRKAIAKQLLENPKVGDIVIFGSYEQDFDTANGKEAIKWKVLANEKGKLLLISEYALDCKPYNEEYEDVTWKTSSIRRWLNGEFIRAAFTGDEQERIAEITVENSNNSEYRTKGGKNTKDKLFLLSIEEAEKYFTSDEARACIPTTYAVANGVYRYYRDTNCDWWLRTPGSSQNYAACVLCDGGVHTGGNYVAEDDGAVRPALWVDIEAK